MLSILTQDTKKKYFREKQVLLSTEALPNNSPSFPRDHMFYFVIRTNNMQRKRASRLNSLQVYSRRNEDCGAHEEQALLRRVRLTQVMQRKRASRLDFLHLYVCRKVLRLGWKMEHYALKLISMTKLGLRRKKCCALSAPWQNGLTCPALFPFSCLSEDCGGAGHTSLA